MQETNKSAAPAKAFEWWRAAVPLALLVSIWFCPCPEGLTAQGMHIFAIFLATIIAILTSPLPSGAVMFIALALAYFSGTLTFAQTLVGFSSGTVWLIFSAYILSLAFVKSGLGRRIAYFMLSRFGGSSLGIAYSLGVADLVMASAMPSVTARVGGIIMPVARSISQAMGSTPGDTGRRIGDYLMMTCFQFTPVTGGVFMTGMAANLLAVQLAKDSLGVELTWGGWFLASVVPSLLAFLALPLITLVVMRPELRRTPEAKAHAKRVLAEAGPLSRQEIKVAAGFAIALLGWGTAIFTGYNANAIGVGIVAYLMVTGALKWEDALAEKSAWDTVIWFGVIISLATGLNKLGFIKWLTAAVGAGLTGVDWMTAFLILAVAYVYTHYVFATVAAHVIAMYVPFCAVAIACGAPAGLVSIVFCILSNPMWGLTEYGSGPGPLYFGQGFFERPKFYSLNALCITMDVALILGTGLLWWKAIGLY